MTIRFIALFFKCSFVKLALAESADKMFRVELLVHSCDTSTGDWFTTTGAERPTLSVEVSLTVRQTLVIKETTGSKRRSTFLNKTFVLFFT